MKNINATNGTSRVQIFLMDDRSTVVGTALSTVTPQVAGAETTVRRPDSG
jgi:hypothetical protein